MVYNINSGYGQKVSNALHAAKINGGKVFMVAKTAQAGRQTLEELFAVDPEGVNRYAQTIDAAVGYTTASRGDVILVAPGHTETLSSATALNLDVAGVTVLGLGEGDLRPQITLDTAASATVAVSAANNVVENLIFIAGFADISAVFTLTTATGFKVKDCSFRTSATDLNFLAIVDTNTTNNAADGLTIEGCDWIEPDTATLYMVKGDADIDKLSIVDCYVNLGVNTSDLPALVNMATGKDLTNLRIEGNEVVRLNDANPLLVVTDTTTANNGVIARNFVRHADTASELLVTASTKIGFFENYATAADDASGYLLPAADS